MSDKKEALVHVNVRLPQAVIDHFKKQPNYTSAIRSVLEKHVKELKD